MLDLHGLKIEGLKNAAGETKPLYPYGPYVQISYDRKTGAVLTDYHVSGQSCCVYDDPQIIHVHNADHPMTMQEIADAIYEAVSLRAAQEAWERDIEADEELEEEV